MTEPTKEPQYVRDTPETRALHGKTLLMQEPDGTNRGLFTLEIEESPKAGFVFVKIYPKDASALEWARTAETCEEIKAL